MRVSADNLEAGANWSAMGERLDTGALVANMVEAGALASVSHLSVCGCAGCLSKLQLPDIALSQSDMLVRTNGATANAASEVNNLAFSLSGGDGPQYAGDAIADNTTTTTSIAVGGTINSLIDHSGDLDYISVQLVAGQTYTFSLDGAGLLDAYVELRDSSGAIIAQNDDGGIGLDSFLMFTATYTGTYYIVTRDWGTGTGNYSLTVDDIATGQTSPTTFTPNTLPFFSWEEAAIQISRSGAGWMSSFGSGAVITYAYRSTAPGTMPDDTAGFSTFSAAQIAATELALAAWAAVANITFVRVNDGAGYSNNATILFGNYASGADGAAAFAYLPTSGNTAATSVEGDVWVNISLPDNVNPLVGNYGFQTILHEIGHALGLSHPGDYNAGSGLPITYPDSADFYGDTRMFTIMSYFASSLTGGTYSNYASLPAMFDIAAIQRLYGANTTTRTGDTVYGFNSNTGVTEYTLTGATSQAVFTVWDGGGNDTLDFSLYAEDGTIDLRQESFSSVGPRTGGTQIAHFNVSIARGVTIENAIGGAGNDTIIGNEVANVIDGRGGFDNIQSGAGNDRITGGAGNDAINGGTGIDTSVYSIASTSASWQRNPNGTWTVTAGVNGTDTLTSVEFLDFTDRDVFLDRAAQTFSGNGTSDVLFRRADGIMASWEVSGTSITTASFLPTAGAAWTPRATGDISGDGRDDIIWQRNDGLVYAWVMNGGAVQSAVALTGIGAEWTFLGLGDFNGDQTDDFAWQRNDGLIYTWSMSASAIAASNAITGLGAEWALQGIGDFNSDGRDDFLWRNTSGQTVIWQMNGASIQSSGFTSTQAGLEWSVAGVGDTNGDGRDDIIMQRASDGLVAVWSMNGTSVTSSTNIAAADPNVWQIQGVGDYNGDGRDDILWQHDNGLVYVWLLNGAAIIGSGGLSGVGGEWDIVGGG